MIPSVENPKLSKRFSFKPGLGQITALSALFVAKIFGFLKATRMVRHYNSEYIKIQIYLFLTSGVEYRI